MSRAPAILVAVVVVIAAAWFFWPLEPEAAIRRELERLEAAFDEASPRRLASHFAEDWVDGPTGADRETLRTVFTGFVLKERDAKTKLFSYDIALDEPLTFVDVVSDTTAAVDMVLIVSRLRRDEEPVVEWKLSVQADMIRVGGRWLIHKCERKTLDGRRPF